MMNMLTTTTMMMMIMELSTTTTVTTMMMIIRTILINSMLSARTSSLYRILLLKAIEELQMAQKRQIQQLRQPLRYRHHPTTRTITAHRHHLPPLRRKSLQHSPLAEKGRFRE
jgi:hypothetical protein